MSEGVLMCLLVVGFTGSGKGMQKDQARTTWKFSGSTEDPAA